MEIYISSDNLITLNGLYDAKEAGYVNDATLKAEIFTFADQETQIGDDVEMEYLTDSDGNYRGQLPNTVALIAGTLYVVKITVTSSTNQLVIKVHADCNYVNET